MPTPIRTIEAFMKKMTNRSDDMIDETAERLRKELSEMQGYSAMREQKVMNAILERNSALYKAEHWRRIAEMFASSCEIDGFGHVKGVDIKQMTEAHSVYTHSIAKDNINAPE